MGAQVVPVLDWVGALGVSVLDWVAAPPVYVASHDCCGSWASPVDALQQEARDWT